VFLWPSASASHKLVAISRQYRLSVRPAEREEPSLEVSVVAKSKEPETVTIVDPGRIRYYVNVTDSEWQTLLEFCKITNNERSLRNALFEFIGKCEQVEHQRPLVKGDKIPLYKLCVEAYLEPKER
jgi:hypothetical protein